MTAVNALVLLPICHSAFDETGVPPAYRVVPTDASMPGRPAGYVAVSETAEMWSTGPRAARYRLKSVRSASI
jgi:hypothetical protein